MLAFAAPPDGPAAAQSLGEVARAGQAALGGQGGVPAAKQGAGGPGSGGLFGSIEFKSDSLDGLPQWTRVLASVERERPSFARCARDSIQCTTPTLRNWRRIITSAAKLSRDDQIRAVNEFFNRWPYKLDQEIYGRREYWATPSEFMARSGDCEDYAIAKYFALRQLGFGKDEMRVVILMDEIRGIGHAVLAIYDKGNILILDSLSNLILTHDRYAHYRPQYSMNETTRWAHVGGFDKQRKSAYKGLVARRN